VLLAATAYLQQHLQQQQQQALRVWVWLLDCRRRILVQQQQSL
jgi:hypothetical protein